MVTPRIFKDTTRVIPGIGGGRETYLPNLSEIEHFAAKLKRFKDWNFVLRPSAILNLIGSGFLQSRGPWAEDL